MTRGVPEDFQLSWLELREEFVRRLVRERFNINVTPIGIRRFDFSKPLDAVVEDVRSVHKHFIQKMLRKIVLRRFGRLGGSISNGERNMEKP